MACLRHPPQWKKVTRCHEVYEIDCGYILCTLDGQTVKIPFIVYCDPFTSPGRAEDECNMRFLELCEPYARRGATIDVSNVIYHYWQTL